MNRKKLESSFPVLAEINLDGNCFFITLIPLVLMFTSNAEVTLLNMVLVGVLAFFLSLGAPNQPGSILIGILVVLNFMQADHLIPSAFVFEVIFGGVLNLINVTGSIVTIYEIEKEEETFRSENLS
jgi:Na+/H+-dicarboxylate symporter